MKSDDPRAEQWRQATTRAIERSTLTQAEVAREIGRAQQQLSDWLGGRGGPPPPDVVFAIEDALGCVDQLSHFLGYVRAKPFDLAAAIAQEPGLSDFDREHLLHYYRLLLSQQVSR